MPRRRDPLDPPRDYVEDWPNGVIGPDVPVAVAYMQRIVVAAEQAMEEQGLTRRAVADMTNLDRSTLRLMLNGYKWPDMVTILKLEQALGTTVWPTYYFDDHPSRVRIARALHKQLPGCTHDEHGSDCLALAEVALRAMRA